MSRCIHLKKVIKGLITAEDISLDDLAADEWLVLCETEIVLEIMACYQHILDGKNTRLNPCP